MGNNFRLIASVNGAAFDIYSIAPERMATLRDGLQYLEGVPMFWCTDNGALLLWPKPAANVHVKAVANEW